jgi:hypothetical protein
MTTKGCESRNVVANRVGELSEFRYDKESHPKATRTRNLTAAAPKVGFLAHYLAVGEEKGSKCPSRQALE